MLSISGNSNKRVCCCCEILALCCFLCSRSLSEKKCELCSENHLLFLYPKFLSMKPQERHRIAKKNNLCIVCLGKSNSTHKVEDYTSKLACRCGQWHNYLLHFEFKSKDNETKATENSDKTNKVTPQVTDSYSAAAVQDRKLILLPTAIAKFKCGDRVGKCHIMFGNCSQPTLISDTFVNQYNLRRDRSTAREPIRGVGTGKLQVNSSVNMSLV